MEIENYDKLGPNAKMLALRKQKQKIEEEKQKIEEQIKELEAQYTKCDCGYLFDLNSVQLKSEEYTKQEYCHSKCEFDDSYYEDVKYLDFIYYCPVCGQKHIAQHLFVEVVGRR